MNDKRTNESPLLFIKDSLIGENVKRSLKTLADLRGVFHIVRLMNRCLLILYCMR
jgi:glucose-6-phosphate isomerase